MKLKLTGRLIVGLVGVALLAVASAAVVYQLVAGNIFDQLVASEASDRFVSDVMTYYQANSTLVGLDQALRTRQQGGQTQLAPVEGDVPLAQPKPGGPAPKPGNRGSPPPGAAPKPQGPPPTGAGAGAGPQPLAFGVADASGKVQVPGGGFDAGRQASNGVLSAGRRVLLDGNFIGTVLLPNGSLPWSASEDEYIQRTRVALGLAAAAGALAAAGIGVIMARGITKPLRQLRSAASQVARGEAAVVPVHGGDEVADLARAFNTMSDELDHAQKARRQMTADIAHELRNPLTTITGYVQAIRDGDLEPSSDRLEAIYRQTVRLGRIVDDLRTLSLADVGSLTLAIRQVEAEELLRATVENYSVEAQRKGVAVRYTPSEQLGPIEADPERLSQVLGNLVSNALRHTPPGGRVSLTGRGDASGVELLVEDTGEGIPPSDLPYIFDRFYRAGEQNKRDVKGSGLGLAIVKAIISAHRGSIEARSNPGISTAFTIRLPRLQHIGVAA